MISAKHLLLTLVKSVVLLSNDCRSGMQCFGKSSQMGKISLVFFLKFIIIIFNLTYSLAHYHVSTREFINHFISYFMFLQSKLQCGKS